VNRYISTIILRGFARPGVDVAAARHDSRIAARECRAAGDRGDSQIVVLNRKTLEPVSTIGAAGAAPGQFQTLHDLAVDSKDNIYTAEIGRGGRAQKPVRQ